MCFLHKGKSAFWFCLDNFFLNLIWHKFHFCWNSLHVPSNSSGLAFIFSPSFLTLCPFLPPSSIVLFDTFVNILSHNLGEPAYEADVAQLEYKLVAGEYGLIIRVKGFNHKLPVSSAQLLTAFMPAALQCVCFFSWQLELWMVGWGVLNSKIGLWQGSAANVLLFLVLNCIKMELCALTQAQITDFRVT